MIKTIVLAYDQTEPAERALDRAAELTQALGARLIVTSVAPIMISTGRGVGPIDPTDTPAEHLAELESAREQLQSRGIVAELQPAIGEPADTIIAVAAESNADLIVVGTREPNILERLLGHSVSQSVSRQAHCDVLIVH